MFDHSLAFDRPAYLGLLALIPAMWWTGHKGNIDLHTTLGLILLALLAFRLLWGVFGSETARFTRFVKGPRAILAYLRAIGDEPGLGHNPLGAL